MWSRVPSLSALRRSATLVNNKWAELRPFTFVIIGDTCSLTVTVYHFLLFTGFVWTVLNIRSDYTSSPPFLHPNISVCLSVNRFFPIPPNLLIAPSIRGSRDASREASSRGETEDDGHENLRSREWLLFQVKNTDLDGEREPSKEPSKENLWNFVMQYSDS